MTYLEWLSEQAIPNEEQRDSYQKLMLALYSEEFYWSVEHDENRAEDGEQLRSVYEDETGLYCEKDGPCSVLEMMLALAMDCEEFIMYDPDLGNRTSIWFWDMIDNLGLSALDDWSFNVDEFDRIMRVFLDRKYDRDGYGGPFFVEGFDKNMRKIELWYQLNYYLKSRYSW